MDTEKIIEQLYQNNSVIKQMVEIIPVEKMTANMTMIISENLQLIEELKK